MKTLFTLMGISLSLTAAACPNLSGTFECDGRDDQVRRSLDKIEITFDGQSSYTITKSDLLYSDEPETIQIIADGKARPHSDDSELTATCSGDQLALAIKVEPGTDEEFTSKLFWALDTDSNFVASHVDGDTGGLRKGRACVRTK